MGNYKQFKAIKLTANPHDITNFTISGTSYANGVYNQNGINDGKKTLVYIFNGYLLA